MHYWVEVVEGSPGRRITLVTGRRTTSRAVRMPTTPTLPSAPGKSER